MSVCKWKDMDANIERVEWNKNENIICFLPQHVYTVSHKHSVLHYFGEKLIYVGKNCKWNMLFTSGSLGTYKIWLNLPLLVSFKTYHDIRKSSVCSVL